MKTAHAQDIFIYGNPVNSTYPPKIFSISKNVWFNKITKITNSLGQELNISYKENKNPYPVQQKTVTTTENSAVTDKIVNNFLPQLEVVNTITAPNINQSYEYNGTEIHRQSKGFLGFSLIKTTDNIRSDTTKVESKLNTTYYFLYPYKSTVKYKNTLISETTQNYTPLSTGTKRYWLRMDSSVSQDALKGITVTTSYPSYDTNTERNPLTIKTDYSNGITSTQALTYVKKGSLFLNKIASSQITQSATGQTDEVRKEYFFYDNKGNITQHTKDSTDVNKVRTSYSDYDQYGNPGKITTTASGISRSKSMTYSPSGRFLKTETDHQFNETTTYNYDESRGLLTSKIDRLGTTSYQYDDFGRPKLTTYPDGIKTTTALQWAGTIPDQPTGAKYYSYEETSGQSPVWVWYDGLDREIRRDSYGLNNKKTMVETEYYTSTNASGLVHYVSDPYFENTSRTWTTTYTYDNYGRILNTVTPMGTTSYAYSNLTTTVTSPVDTRKTTVNPAGWVVEEESNGKKVNFTHYANGLVKKATPEDGTPQGGPAISMEYDLQGNRTKLTDPDAGVITSQYDGWGQLSWEKQAIHNSSLITTDYQYYPSGLLQYKLRNGEKTNYSYDNLYRLKGISIAGKHAQGFVYDQYDRIVQTNDTVEGSKVFVSKTDYDQLGRVFKETYPSGYYTTNQYDRYSNLTAATDNSGRTVYKPLTANARGQILTEQKGANTTTYAYDNMGRQTMMHGGNTPVYFMLTYNPSGNLQSRVQYSPAMQTEVFNYDDLNRLTDWNAYNYNQTLSKQSGIVYDAKGNIYQKTDLGNYTLNYGANGKPHALTSISGVPAQFPQLPSDSLRVTYTDFKKMKTLTQGNKFYEITYGIDEQRIKSEYRVNNVTQETHYYIGNYEEVTNGGITKKIHYLSGGAILIMIGNTETLYYGYYDHLGSLIALENAQNNVVEHYAYDPWGNRRNPLDWTQPDSRTSWIVNRGFTGHEHLDAFGIINMNGRVYDPLTAIFFSPDPYVQAPDNWLNYNRYTYCMNNPLKYVDPDGEIFWLIPVAIGAIVGGYIGGGIQSGDWNPISSNYWNNGWQGFISGAIVGATLGYGVSGAIGATGMTTTVTNAAGQTVNVATKAAGITSSMLNSGTINIAMNAMSGGGWDGAWKAGVAGLAMGGWNATGGFGMVKGFGATSDIGKLAGKLGYQMVGTSMGSIGNNWARG
ncbi:MAG: hypothetical protein FWD60_13015, partial [Candidatus Azobacteroides sp.]|nr:hypothetical protein [Candidatus Azobacteroides sp.]